jgi:hypothetical protein
MKRQLCPLLLATLVVCGMTSRGRSDAETVTAEEMAPVREAAKSRLILPRRSTS